MYKTNIHQSGTQLSIYEFLAVKHNADSLEGVLKVFFSDKKESFTAEDILNLFPGNLLTSIRRSLSNLKNEGYLIKGEKKVGSHGVKIIGYKKA